MRFELFIASRYLRAKRRQAFIGIITGISVVGVAAGVASLVVALAINNGFRQDLQQRLLGSTSHISLLRIADDGIQDWPALMDRLSKQPHVVATAPAIFEQVLISRGPRARGAVLKGMIPRYERRVGDLLSSVKQGSADALDEENVDKTNNEPGFQPGQGGSETRPNMSGGDSQNPAGKSARSTQANSTQANSTHANSTHAISTQADASKAPDSLAEVHDRVASMPPIILGQDMADYLGASVGSVVLVTSPQGELTPFGMVPKYNRFRVAGIFNSGFYDYDSNWSFTRLADAQRLFGLGSLISVMVFKVDDIYKADVIGRQIEEAAGKGFMTTNWMEQNKPLFHALNQEKLLTSIIIGLIVVVAALNILISLIMMVMEKTKDIAVLMSMGTRKAQVRKVFISQGVLIGVIGTAIGLVLGYALSYLGGRYHIISLSPEVYSIDYIPFAPRISDGFYIALAAIGISFVATIYPSWSASRILPAEALRYE
jgi:lipoprotein-releasing system permease protein